jgi:BTB/POZ domain-containing protein KCTD9
VVKRLDYEASCRRLHELGLAYSEPAPPVPERKPRQDDDEPLGLSFFRTRVTGDFSGLTLPRTFFGRSEISEASFRGTDLHESTLCWNDFIDVDFSQAILTNADLRASLFEGVSFAEADLAFADLRISTFTHCVFDRASMKGTILTRRQGKTLSLSASQIGEISWTDDEGDDPSGG